MTHPDVATLGDALYWAQRHWTVRELPMRLHSGGVEPESRLGAPRAAAQFLAYLMASPDDHSILSEQSQCLHPRLAQRWDREAAQVVYLESLFRCPDCQGSGSAYKSGIRWRFPMWRALRAVKACVGKPHQPHPIVLIAALVLNAWDTEHAAAFLSMDRDDAEPLFLMALRKLHDKYEHGPLPAVAWVDKSDSQRNAEEAVA